MENKLQIFNYHGNDVRTIQINGESWWVLKDICDVLELGSPHKVANRLDEDERNLIPVTDNIGRQQQTNVVNESGLYNVILRSDKPEAKKFKRWITHEVVPQIRKHGAYITPDTLERVMSDPDTWITLITSLKAERTAKEKLLQEAAINKPKVIFADAVSVSDDTISIGQLAKHMRAKGIDIGQNRLFDRLRENEYLIKRKGSDYNLPTQTSMDAGLFEIKATAVTQADGNVKVYKTTRVTGKGQQYFINRILGEVR